MLPSRFLTCWACTAILVLIALQTAIYTGMFSSVSQWQKRHTVAPAGGTSTSAMESLSMTLTYTRWFNSHKDQQRPKHGQASSSMSAQDMSALAETCRTAVDIPKVALLFLVRGDLPHRTMWTMWLRSAQGQLPTNVRYNQYLSQATSSAPAGEDQASEHNADQASSQQSVSPAQDGQQSSANMEQVQADAAVNSTPAVDMDAGDREQQQSSQQHGEVVTSAATLFDPSESVTSSQDARVLPAVAPAEGRLNFLQWARNQLGWVRPTSRRRVLQESEDLPLQNLATADGVQELDAQALQALTEQVAKCQQHLEGVDYVVAQQYLYSVYVHPPPNVTLSPDPVFHPNVITDRIYTEWGTHNLTRASKKLLAAGLQDPRNQWFVLLSESCIPLYPPQAVYQQLVHTSKSRINACRKDYRDNRDVRRWTHKMTSGMLKRRHWRKSWQWFGLLRKHAQLAVDDTHVDDIFHTHCVPGYDHTYRRYRDCYSDEHYIPTLLAASGLDKETDCHGFLNYVDWSQYGAHPKSFYQGDVTLHTLHSLRNQDCKSDAAIKAAHTSFVTWNSFGRHDNKVYANRTSATVDSFLEHHMPDWCPLFARKFVAESAGSILAVFRDCTNKLNILSQEMCIGYGR